MTGDDDVAFVIGVDGRRYPARRWTEADRVKRDRRIRLLLEVGTTENDLTRRFCVVGPQLAWVRVTW
jgi:hypothetical protein